MAAMSATTLCASRAGASNARVGWPNAEQVAFPSKAAGPPRPTSSTTHPAPALPRPAAWLSVLASTPGASTSGPATSLAAGRGPRPCSRLPSSPGHLPPRSAPPSGSQTQASALPGASVPACAHATVTRRTGRSRAAHNSRCVNDHPRCISAAKHNRHRAAPAAAKSRCSAVAKRPRRVRTLA